MASDAYACNLSLSRLPIKTFGDRSARLFTGCAPVCCRGGSGTYWWHACTSHTNSAHICHRYRPRRTDKCALRHRLNPCENNTNYDGEQEPSIHKRSHPKALYRHISRNGRFLVILSRTDFKRPKISVGQPEEVMATKINGLLSVPHSGP